jgi:hypothetical protein
MKRVPIQVTRKQVLHALLFNIRLMTSQQVADEIAHATGTWSTLRAPCVKQIERILCGRLARKGMVRGRGAAFTNKLHFWKC